MINRIYNILFGCLLMMPLSLFGKDSKTDLFYRVQHAITNILVHDIFSPPVASRIYLYNSVAAYEASRTAPQLLPPFSKARPDFPLLQIPDSLLGADAALSAAYATMLMAEKFVFSESQLRDSMKLILEKEWPNVNKSIRAKSKAWALIVVDKVFAWSKTDNYKETRKLRRYSHGRNDSVWVPTPPGYIAAVEPYWGKMRTVVIKHLDDYRPAPPMAFGKTQESTFYKQAHEVYTKSKSMSHEDTAIALFWDCNPFHLTSQGHLNYATKKLSPGGHWMSITGIACKQSAATIHQSVVAYLVMAIALYDGFISCWYEKFRSNLIRPETYINAYIDESWRPLLQTPPFPEYSSGHSVISAAAAEALTALFGDNFTYADNTETRYGLPIRNFSSFRNAAKEAALSRFTGGIHYREGIEFGSIQGEKIGKAVVDFWQTFQRK